MCIGSYGHTSDEKILQKMKKRKQHHVWKSYLRAWAHEEKIFCLQSGRVFESNICDVAVERDFYKLPTLSKEDIGYIRLLIGKSPNPATRLYKDFLMLFSIFGWLKDNPPPHMANDPEFESLIDQQLRTLACKARDLYGTPALGRLEDDFNSVNVLCHPKKPKTAHGLRPLRQSFFT